jgi:CubicO group peptidase (beta-lactamase class C family)
MLKQLRLYLTAGAVLIVAVALMNAGTHGQTGIDARIARVEGGLLPRAVLKEQVGRRMSIAERMAYHGIAGMSMAVIEDGQIAWARAYGVRERGSQNPVTSETLFQAASLSKPVSAFGALLHVQDRRLELDAGLRPSL